MRYLNPKQPKQAFQFLLNSPYVVDKTGILSTLAPFINVENRFVCVTRPRRFGKTVNANIIACFLARGLDATGLFEGTIVSHDSQAMQHLGNHDVIYLDFSQMPASCETYADYIGSFSQGIVDDLRMTWPQARLPEGIGVVQAFEELYIQLDTSFVFVIDEWDSMFFNLKFTQDDQQSFLMFLKQLLKGKPYVELAYMTGILPIAKHSTGSELNMFVEYSAADDPKFERFFGFTEDEVRGLCKVHEQRVSSPRVTYDGLAFWYDGYLNDDGGRRFNPRSVVLALADDALKSYWTDSGPYDEIYYYIEHDVAAVRDDVVRLVAGEKVSVRLVGYAASAMSLTTKDEIFSAMVVYGFLTYHDGYVSIPNHELMLQFERVLGKEKMGYVARLAQRSEEMLAATLHGDTPVMCEIIQAAHDQEVPLLRYANESDLAALVNLVYLAARDRYDVRREEPCGRGIADVAFVPRDSVDPTTPPFIVELKAGGTVEEALGQIKARGYAARFRDGLLGTVSPQPPLAVAIVWDPKNKVHDCAVERLG